MDGFHRQSLVRLLLLSADPRALHWRNSQDCRSSCRGFPRFAPYALPSLHVATGAPYALPSLHVATGAVKHQLYIPPQQLSHTWPDGTAGLVVM